MADNQLNKKAQQKIENASIEIKKRRSAELQNFSENTTIQNNAKNDNKIDDTAPTGEIVFYDSLDDEIDDANEVSPIEQIQPSEPDHTAETKGEETIVSYQPEGNADYDNYVDISAAKTVEDVREIKKQQLEGGEAKANPDLKTNYNSNNNPAALKKRKKRKILSVISCILAVLMILSGSGCIVMYSYLSSVNYQAIDSDVDDIINKDNKSNNGTGSQTSSHNTDTYEGKLLNDKQILNVLLIGADTRKGQDKGNSDTMILLSVDTKNKKLKLLSFMRDTWVAIPGYDDNKLNASFTYGGAELTVKTIQANYGIQIDRYAIVDFKSFKKIIDKLGGIDIELTQEEVDYIDWQTWMNNQADTRNELNAYSYTYTPNEKGEEVTKIHLNGRQALWHARNRGEDGICSGDDYVRTQRQRNVISIMINKIKQSDTNTLLNTLSEIGSMITTNLKSSEILALAQNITKYLKYDIVSQSAPDSSTIAVDFVYSDYYYNPTYVYGEFVDAIVINDWNDFRSKIADFVFSNENKLKKQEEAEESTAEE